MKTYFQFPKIMIQICVGNVMSIKKKKKSKKLKKKTKKKKLQQKCTSTTK